MDSSITSGVFALIGALGGAAVTAYYQSRQSEAVYLQQRERDKTLLGAEWARAKHQRLLQRYEDLAISVEKVDDLITQIHLLAQRGKSAVQRQKDDLDQIDAELQTELLNLQRCATLISLESDHTDIIYAYQDLRMELKWFDYDASLGIRVPNQPKIHQKIIELQGLMRSHLQALEKSV